MCIEVGPVHVVEGQRLFLIARLVWFRVISSTDIKREQIRQFPVSRGFESGLRKPSVRQQYREEDRKTKKTKKRRIRNGFWNKFCEKDLPSCSCFCFAQVTLLGLAKRYVLQKPGLSWSYRLVSIPEGQHSFCARAEWGWGQGWAQPIPWHFREDLSCGSLSLEH